MRWENLFDDLEGQLEHELDAEAVDLRAEEERLRLGRLSLRDRLRSLHRSQGRAGTPVTMSLIDGRLVAIMPLTFGKDWLSGDLLDGGAGRVQCIVPLSAIASVQFQRSQLDPSLDSADGDDQPLAARLGLAFALRDLCRRRRAVDLELLVGRVHGTIDRVGRDHFDLAVHDPGSARREREVTQYRSIPFSQLLLVRL